MTARRARRPSSARAHNHPVVRPATAGAAWEQLIAEFPAMAGYTPAVSCAVNEEYARFGAALGEGDEVAFLPPVSGG